MKTIIVNIVSAASLVIAASALAVDMPPEGKAKCGVCHAVDTKKVGPSFMDVSSKYKGDKDAANKIVESITKGGSFGWNLGKMPAKGMGATDAQIKSMAEFIAGLAK
jgi:cytochrome c